MDWKNVWGNLVAQAIWVTAAALTIVIVAYARSIEPHLILLSTLIAVAAALVIWREGEDRFKRWRKPAATAEQTVAPTPPASQRSSAFSGSFGERYRAPFGFEPITRFAEGNDQLIRAQLRISNQHTKPEPVRGCRARLVSLSYEDNALNEDGYPSSIARDANIVPVYLKWIEQDGGGGTCTFINDATLEVARVDLVTKKGYVQVENASLGKDYILDLTRKANLVIQVVDETGRFDEHGFEIEPNPYITLAKLMSDGKSLESFTASQSLQFRVSQRWLSRALEKIQEWEKSQAHKW